jgi:hypothetical protein
VRGQTSYDRAGIFTGSVSVVNGTPIATYPGEPGDSWCDASPLDLTDPLLKLWKKSPLNPLGNDATMGTTGGPLGCTAAWKEPSGNWTTTIQSNKHGGTGLKTAFFTSHNFIDWSWVGNLDCPVCDKLVTPCSDFYPVTCASPDCADPPSGNRWIFGVNTMGRIRAGGMITGTFDRTTLKLTPDNPQWAAEVLADPEMKTDAAELHYAYDYGVGLFPKTCKFTSAASNAVACDL